jgi:hypothetical protein
MKKNSIFVFTCWHDEPAVCQLRRAKIAHVPAIFSVWKHGGGDFSFCAGLFLKIAFLFTGACYLMSEAIYVVASSAARA